MTTTLIEQTEDRSADFIGEPVSAADLGIDRGLLIDLALKTLFYRGRTVRSELSNTLRISGAATQELMHALTQDELASVLGSDGTGPAAYMYALTQKGLDRAEAAFARSGYVGPVPVPLADYIRQVKAQTVNRVRVTREQVIQALGGLVMSDETITRIGRAASSHRSTLVHGASGNGKTTVAQAIGTAISGSILIPHAIEMVGQIVHLYDPSKHETVDDGPATTPDDLLRSRPDRRWLRIRRPVIWAGGELTKHSLELMHDEAARLYEAPLQLKANGGTLIIDDFGRQQIPAVALLNRWIGALEGAKDHLTLHTGQTVEMPFDMLVLFSTNLTPTELADDAFLRRIRYKIEVPNPTSDEYIQIFERECARQGVRYEEKAVRHLLHNWYETLHRELRGCHPRDLVEAIVDACRYDERHAEVTTQAIDEACATYFLRPPDERA